MAKRYDQYCPVAHALDAVGDRWALLVVRELMHGAKRYTDLVDRAYPRHSDGHTLMPFRRLFIVARARS